MRYAKGLKNGRTYYKHRLVVEAALGRDLDPRREKVHHKNEDTLDNRLENLEVTTPKEHSRHHMLIHPLTRHCVFCGTEFTPLPSHRPRDKTCSRPCKCALICVARIGVKAKRIDFEELYELSTSRVMSDNRIAKRTRASYSTVQRIRKWPASLPAQVNKYVQTKYADRT